MSKIRENCGRLFLTMSVAFEEVCLYESSFCGGVTVSLRSWDERHSSSVTHEAAYGSPYCSIDKSTNMFYNASKWMRVVFSLYESKLQSSLYVHQIHCAVTPDVMSSGCLINDYQSFWCHCYLSLHLMCLQLYARRCVWLYIVKDIMMSLSGISIFDVLNV